MTCELVRRRDRDEAPAWDRIMRTPSWDVVHAFGTSLEGWLVLVLRRHAEAVADLQHAEAAELGPLIAEVSVAMREVLGCDKTYVAQFAEHRDHPHVHFHLIPRSNGLPERDRGPAVFGRLGVTDDEAVDEGRRSEIAESFRRQLALSSSIRSGVPGLPGHEA